MSKYTEWRCSNKRDKMDKISSFWFNGKTPAVVELPPIMLEHLFQYVFRIVFTQKYTAGTRLWK
uniref:Uncharacterized protein n=1 Tax=Heterorhabditis bacteriophora TaxID=37862 RepID=A0A1I7WVM1_HETBA